MDAHRFLSARRRLPASLPDRFLSVFPPSGASAPDDDEELNEDDIFSAEVSSPTSNIRLRRLQPSAPLSPSSDYRLHPKGFNPFTDQSGILAALPDSIKPSNHFYQKSNLSSSSSSAASSPRLIPKPPHERIPIHPASSLTKLHPQSAPVNVPIMNGRRKLRRADGSEFDELDEDYFLNGDGDHEMLPPHEVVARSRSSVVACSVLEGVGRTLKGRDLRRVRNAVFHSTGFID